MDGLLTSRPTHFNSIKVQLEPGSSVFVIPNVRNFNSIKVQLEPLNRMVARGDTPKFQFHKGTIRTKGDPEFIRFHVISIP